MADKNPIRSHASSTTPVRARMLQRKCACGADVAGGGECEECKKKATLERAASGLAAPARVPPIVHEVLRSHGEPLDPAARALMEPRFGVDFSKVRLHADAKAAESARAVGALAYTVGKDIVFANRPSVPGSAEETRVLAHELTHVVQQSGGSEGRANLQVGSIDSPAEREAEQTASAVVSDQPSAPPVHAGTPSLQRQPAQAPAQKPAPAPAPAPTQAAWGAKNWPGYENDWNAFYQLAVQGLAGGSLKPEKIAHLAADIADRCMHLCLSHGKQAKCAVAAATDQESKRNLDLFLPWGPTGLWGTTFRSAVQSTTQSVDGPKSAEKMVQRAGDIADQAVRGMLGDSAWNIYMNCKLTGTPSSPAPAPKAAAPGGH